MATDARLLGIRHGRALLAIRENEEVAASFGVRVATEKLRAFLISGGVAGLAGSLFAYQVTVVVKGSFLLAVSLTYLIVVVSAGWARAQAWSLRRCCSRCSRGGSCGSRAGM